MTAFLIGCFIGLCFIGLYILCLRVRFSPPPPVSPLGERPRPEPGIVIQEGIMPEAPSGVRGKTKAVVRDLIKPLSRYEIARGQKS